MRREGGRKKVGRRKNVTIEIRSQATSLARAGSRMHIDSAHPMPVIEPQDEPIGVEAAISFSDPRGRHCKSVCAVCLLSVMCGGMGGAAAPFILEPVRQV